MTQIGLFNALIYFTSHFCIKLAILFFYRRVFTLRITWFKYAWYAVLFYITGWFISSFFAGLFQWYRTSLSVPQLLVLLLT